MVEKGLNAKLRNTMEEMKVWTPDEAGKGKSGQAEQDAG